MCKQMLVILVNRVVDPKRIIGKMEGQGGGEAQGVADPPKKSSGRFLTTLVSPRGDLSLLGGMITPLFTPRGEHSLL
jgi:hypothetical protein